MKQEIVLLLSSAFLGFLLPLGTPILDILLSLNILASLGLLLFTIRGNHFLFTRVLTISIVVTMFTAVLAFKNFVMLDWAGEVISAFGNYIAAGNYILGSAKELTYYLVFILLLLKVFPKEKTAALPMVQLYKYASFFLIILFAMVLFGLPLLSVALHGMDIQKAILSNMINGLGFGAVFLWVSGLQMLSIGSFLHRHVIPVDLDQLRNNQSKWSWPAAIFNTGWYFYKGILGKGFLLVLFVFTVRFVFGFPAWLAALPIMIYCGLRGNKDYYESRSETPH